MNVCGDGLAYWTEIDDDAVLGIIDFPCFAILEEIVDGSFAVEVRSNSASNSCEELKFFHDEE